MNGHIILSSNDGVYIVDNMQSAHIDRQMSELILAGGGHYFHIDTINPDALLETIKNTFYQEGATFIEVTSDD